ncbi:nucleotidyltransferase domain-containing protein [Caproiciproducens sp.]
MKYTEDTLSSWTSPLSQTEEQRVENTIRMIKDAVTSYDKLSDCTMEVFAQGSYANNTNVRQDSDVDICVMLTSTVFCNYVDGKTDEDYGYTTGSITYNDYKSYIVEALKGKFGEDVVAVGNKSINIKSNSYHVNADVVPAFQYRDFKIINSIDPAKYVEGIKYFAKDGTEVINYPKDHINNGKQKNNNTNYEYKKLVRIMKHTRNDMVDDGKVNGDKITSFLIECLVWNVPNDTITGSNTWSGTVQNAIAYLWKSIKDENHQEWGEVSERLYLFHPGRKWTAVETKDFLCDMYNYLEFE